MIRRAPLLPLLAALAACAPTVDPNAVPSSLPADVAPVVVSPLDSLVTVAERTNFRETSRYADVVAYMEEVDRASPVIHVTGFGTTNEGRTLPLAVVGRVRDASAEAVRASGKTVVYLQGNIHAGEVEGKESLLILLRELAAGEHAQLLDSLVLLIAPIYNADGNERVAYGNRPRQNGPIGGMGTRANAQGLDLNRDQMKLDAPEARAVARLMTEYDPAVLIDLHTTNGSFHAYHLTYAPPLSPATPARIDRILRDRWLPAVTDSMRSRGWFVYHYGNVPSEEEGNAGAERGWYTFDHRPRFVTNYAGVRNRFGILSEAYAYLPFGDRVRVTDDFTDEVLDWAWSHATEIRRTVQAADAERLIGSRLPLTARMRRMDTVTILMGEVTEQRHPVDNQVMFLRRDTVIPERMPEWQAFDAAETESVPQAYLVPAAMGDVLDRLAAHGVRTEPLAPGRYDAEAFRVDSTRVAGRAFQGHTERRTWGRWVPTSPDVGNGWVMVRMDQPLARLVFTLLEPRSDDGFAAWNLVSPMEPGTAYPILRLPSRTAP